MTNDRERIEEFVAVAKEAIAEIEEVGKFTHMETYKGCMLLCLDLFVIYTKLAEPSKLDEVKELMCEALDAIKRSVQSVTPEQNERYVAAVKKIQEEAEKQPKETLVQRLERQLLGDLNAMLSDAEKFKSE